MTAIQKGDILTIKPQWRDPGDESKTWVARSDERNGWVDISDLAFSRSVFWPLQSVRTDMVERIGGRIAVNPHKEN